jgi:hypothetical protein
MSLLHVTVVGFFALKTIANGKTALGRFGATNFVNVNEPFLALVCLPLARLNSLISCLQLRSSTTEGFWPYSQTFD